MKDYKKVAVKTWYLKFDKTIPGRSAKLKVELWENPSVNEYLEIYNVVGKEWGWAGKLLMPKENLKKILSDERNEVWKCYSKNELIGFFEINRSEKSKAEIVYLGLLPEFIGKGFGKDFLNCAINIASGKNKDGVWLHTCEFDHKKALNTYLKAGFKVEKETIEHEYYPVEFLKKHV